MKGLEAILKKKNITLDVDDQTRKMLALSGFTPKYGARQIGGTIRQQIRRPISRMIVAGEVVSGNIIKVTSNDQALNWNVV